MRYTFPSDLSVLAGPTGVGKTTLLELVKFGYGGEAEIAEVARDYVVEVRIDTTLGDSRFRLARTIDPSKRKTVRVIDLVARERLADHYTTNAEPRLSSLLLSALGLPDDMRAPSRTNVSRNTGSRISFIDIFGFLYVPQREINRDIAHSDESVREPKRKAVFELLFGLTDADTLNQRSLINELQGKIDTAEIEARNVAGFLASSNTTTQENAHSLVQEARSVEAKTKVRITELRAALDPVEDRKTSVLRDLLADTERTVADCRSQVVALQRREREYRVELQQVQDDLDRLSRISDAGHRLADIEFEVCPRCVQSLATREVPTGACRVCLQPDPAPAGTAEFDQYESKQLRDQFNEIESQLHAASSQIEETSNTEATAVRRVAELTALIESRTRERITPRLQAFADLSERLAEARSLQREMEGTLRQWDRLQDLELAARELRSERENAKAELQRLEEALEERREQIFSDLNEEYGHTISLLGVPGITSASIDSRTYLPVINGTPWRKHGPRGGGITTAAQTAYWATLLAVAQKHSWTHYPAFLLVDSPRQSVNDSEALSQALYRRLVALADTNREFSRIGVNRAKIQIIIADNSLPTAYRSDYAQVDFSIENPTVPTIRHPGPAKVKLLGS
ncbi:AAA family ATPase [Actinocatenispora thailandica]|uniref:AAA family ATPase n=1 Tax=Actinocatenispora thailandica TaxID=227318 RepID=UPI0031DE8706